MKRRYANVRCSHEIKRVPTWQEACNRYLGCEAERFRTLFDCTTILRRSSIADEQHLSQHALPLQLGQHVYQDLQAPLPH